MTTTLTSPSVMSVGAPTTIEERLTSSKIVFEQCLSQMPNDLPMRIIEVPVIQEQIKYVPKKEVREILKEVKRREVRYIERVVHVPRTQIVETIEEVPEFQEVVRYVPRRQIVDVPREVIRHVPRIEIRSIEKEKFVSRDMPRRSPRPYLVDKRVVIPHFVDKEVPTIVSQKVIPVVIANSELDTVEVEVDSFEPVLVPIDVHVPKAVPVEFLDSSVLKEETRRAEHIDESELYNIFLSLNKDITSKGLSLQLTAEELFAMSTASRVGAAAASSDGKVDSRKDEVWSSEAPVDEVQSESNAASVTSSSQSVPSGVHYSPRESVEMAESSISEQSSGNSKP
eukprot:Lankesteria_metandrocarpae@DN2334_c0_g1_i1.p1